MKVNFSSNEAEAKAFEVPPTGEYLVCIVDGSIEAVKAGDNVGKPYWKLRFVIQDGKYAGASIFTNIMLFDGALYGISMLLKALGYVISEGENEIPELEDLLGKPFYAKGYKRPAKTDQKSGRDLPERFEVKSYSSANSVPSDNNADSRLP